MLVPLIVKTDYSLLKSLVKIKDLINFLTTNNIDTCAITDSNLFGCIEFYNACREKNIKPIIGLEVIINEQKIYLYAEDFTGYQNLLKLNTILMDRDLTVADLSIYGAKVACTVKYYNYEIYEELSKIFKNIFIFYNSTYEKNNALIYTKNIVYANESLAFNQNDTNYLKYLHMIETGASISHYEDVDDKDKFFKINVDEEDRISTINFAKLCNLEIPMNSHLIPHFNPQITDSYKYLVALAKKGLVKRLDNNVPKSYMERLKFELNTINNMGFVDYFLIVYDYVKYAKANNILSVPRGSAAGSLVAYVLGISNVDPLKYGLLFERFLNPERITMPDIDVDFEDTKRDQVINYVKNKYGFDKVAPIMTFGTLKSKQALRDVAKALEIPTVEIDKLVKMIDATQTLKKNLQINKNLYDYVSKTSVLKNVYRVAMKVENLKRHISTHAAGVVISASPLDTIIPICKSGDGLLTGVTMEYLECLGLLKMDFLALTNLSVIQNVLKLIEKNTNEQIDINKIPLDDTDTLKLFETVNTVGIFQYESAGMINFLRKLKPKSFSDLVAAVALFRPGPMENIDTFIKRKEGKIAIDYPHESLRPILEETYGIIVYQEQIMQILVKMAAYSFAEADNIRRAMSKKKKDIMISERDIFIKKSQENGYDSISAAKVYDLILKFANYGFNKAHSVSYALVGYQMAYLKSKYPTYFMGNLLNMAIGSEVKIKEYLDEAKKLNIKIFKPALNSSEPFVKVMPEGLMLPLTVIKNVGATSANFILEERKKKKYKDFFDFVARTYGKSITKKTLEALIDADVFREFNINHQSLYNNIDNAITYAELARDLDESLVMKPVLEKFPEFSEFELMQKELGVFGFYVSNHPASKYNDSSIMKLNDIQHFFDKRVKCIVIITNIKTIKTKNNDNMTFMTGSDETCGAEFIIFPNKNYLLNNIKRDELVSIYGLVTKRFDKYQITVSNIESIK